MERPELDDWMKRSAEVLAEVDPTISGEQQELAIEEAHRKRFEAGLKAGKLVIPDIEGKDI